MTVCFDMYSAKLKTMTVFLWVDHLLYFYLSILWTHITNQLNKSRTVASLFTFLFNNNIIYQMITTFMMNIPLKIFFCCPLVARRNIWLLQSTRSSTDWGRMYLRTGLMGRCFRGLVGISASSWGRWWRCCACDISSHSTASQTCAPHWWESLWRPASSGTSSPRTWL